MSDKLVIYMKNMNSIFSSPVIAVYPFILPSVSHFLHLQLNVCIVFSESLYCLFQKLNFNRFQNLIIDIASYPQVVFSLTSEL